MALYTIEPHGCLSGVYADNDVHGGVFSEIARLKDTATQKDDDIIGDYETFYFDADNRRRNCCLRITGKSCKSQPFSIYHFEWTEDGVCCFYGTGYRMNKKHVAVHYTKG